MLCAVDLTFKGLFHWGWLAKLLSLRHDVFALADSICKWKFLEHPKCEEKSGEEFLSSKSFETEWPEWSVYICSVKV